MVSDFDELTSHGILEKHNTIPGYYHENDKFYKLTDRGSKILAKFKPKVWNWAQLIKNKKKIIEAVYGGQ